MSEVQGDIPAARTEEGVLGQRVSDSYLQFEGDKTGVYFTQATAIGISNLIRVAIQKQDTEILRSLSDYISGCVTKESVVEMKPFSNCIRK